MRAVPLPQPPATLAGAGAALLWALTCLAWFDPGRQLLPAARPCAGRRARRRRALLGAVWLRARWPALRGPRSHGASGRRPAGRPSRLLLSSSPGVAGGRRLHDAGRRALRDRGPPRPRRRGPSCLRSPRAVQRQPEVPPHRAPRRGLDPARAFALVSVLFYALFVAAVYRLGLLAGGGTTAVAAGLYAAFAPAYVTHYSLSNDGNYVEVLALGTWALVLAIRWWREEESRPPLAARRRAAARAGLLVPHPGRPPRRRRGPRLPAAGWRSLRSWALLALGGVLGAFPSLLWNAQNGWLSLQYLLPGGRRWARSKADRGFSGARGGW